MFKIFGKHGKMVWEYANGIDNSEVVYTLEKPKGIGNSITLPKDYSNIEEIEEVLVALVDQVAYRLRCENMLAEVVNVQIKTNEFKVFSHQRKLMLPTDNTKEILEEAKKLLKELYKGQPIRLLGVRVDKLTDKEEVQISFFDKEPQKQNNIDKVVDELKEKFGYEKITRAGKMNLDKNIKFKE